MSGEGVTLRMGTSAQEFFRVLAELSLTAEATVRPVWARGHLASTQSPTCSMD